MSVRDVTGRIRMTPGSRGAKTLSFACAAAGSVCLLLFTIQGFRDYLFLAKSFVFGVSVAMSMVSVVERDRVLASAFLLTAVISVPYPLDPYLTLAAGGLLSSVMFFVSSAKIASRGNLPPIPDSDLAIIRSEYLKAESMRKQAEEEIKRAVAERAIADALTKKAREVLASANRPDNGARVSALGLAYEDIGVHETDSEEAIREIYLGLARIYHPDKYVRSGDLSQRQKTFRIAQINASYDTIMRSRKARKK